MEEKLMRHGSLHGLLILKSWCNPKYRCDYFHRLVAGGP